jgi:predicted anti-sigma-YlaC factor YlaD
MSTRDSELDRHLRALFSGLDTGADFEGRLLARLQAESRADATQRTLQAGQQERARYRRAVLELQGWRLSTLRLLTLDTLGIALLLVVVVVAAWPRFGRVVLADSRHYSAYVAMVLSILIAAVPLLGMWTEQTRRSIRLL